MKSGLFQQKLYEVMQTPFFQQLLQVSKYYERQIIIANLQIMRRSDSV